MSRLFTTVDMGCLGEVEVEVRYKYYRGYAGHGMLPDEEACVELVHVVMSNKLDVLDLLDEDTKEYLESLAMDEQRGEAAYVADMRFEQMREARLYHAV